MPLASLKIKGDSKSAKCTICKKSFTETDKGKLKSCDHCGKSVCPSCYAMFDVKELSALLGTSGGVLMCDRCLVDFIKSSAVYGYRKIISYSSSICHALQDLKIYTKNKRVYKFGKENETLWENFK